MVLGHDIRQSSRTQDVQISHNITFDTMLLNPETLQGLKTSGFYKPSPIQLHGIPLGKCGFDVLLEAKSGTGKTAVFAVIALEKLDLSKGLQVIILAPTREIAAQICDVLKQIGSFYKGLRVEVVMGGLPIEEDIKKFKSNVHIVVASPGRLSHLIRDKHVNTSRVRLLVLDEADKLVEKSFQEDVKYIYSCLPTQKQVIMSSATYAESAKSFILNYVQNAQHVCPNSNCVLLGVDQKISRVKHNTNIVKQTQLRFQEVLKIFSKVQFKQCLIFCNYQVRVSELRKLLLRAKWPAEQLYGSQDQTDRLEALKTLQEYKCRVLIATDLAARGIDASNIDLVINFEPPLEWQTYLHRIGRAGRYGSYGMSITILSEGAETKKFQTMLEPMKDTISITDLWCDNEITFDKDCTSKALLNNEEKFKVPYKSKEIVQETQELWKILISDKIENQNNLKSFEELCASFNNSEDIKTFDELIKSFENYQLTDEDPSFKNIKMDDEHSKDIWASLKKYFNNITEAITDNQLQHRNEKNDNNNGTCMVNSDKECQSRNKRQSETNHHIDKTTKSSTENNNEYLYHDKNCNNSIEMIAYIQGEPTFLEHELEIHNDMHVTDSKLQRLNKQTRKSIENAENSLCDTEEALLVASRPTAFGKRVNNGKSQKNAKQSKTSTLVSKTRNTRQETLNIQAGSSSRQSKFSDTKCNTTYNDDYNYSSSCPEKSYYVNTQKTCKSAKGEKQKVIEYNNWYRQLKLQTMQIEMAIYIDELSKL